MKPNELRIGNLVINREDYDVFEITEGWEIDNIGLYEPIPLTEEWLLKFGLTKEKDRSMGFNYTNNSKKFKLVMYKGNYGVKRSNYYKTEYIHQLQNLYFALTGEELTIKETVT
jgi:hypothetical protein